jgi:hypothetical protein
MLQNVQNVVNVLGESSFKSFLEVLEKYEVFVSLVDKMKETYKQKLTELVKQKKENELYWSNITSGGHVTRSRISDSSDHIHYHQPVPGLQPHPSSSCPSLSGPPGSFSPKPSILQRYNCPSLETSTPHQSSRFGHFFKQSSSPAGDFSQPSHMLRSVSHGWSHDMLHDQWSHNQVLPNFNHRPHQYWANSFQGTIRNGRSPDSLHHCNSGCGEHRERYPSYQDFHQSRPISFSDVVSHDKSHDGSLALKPNPSWRHSNHSMVEKSADDLEELSHKTHKMRLAEEKSHLIRQTALDPNSAFPPLNQHVHHAYVSSFPSSFQSQDSGVFTPDITSEVSSPLTSTLPSRDQLSSDHHSSQHQRSLHHLSSDLSQDLPPTTQFSQSPLRGAGRSTNSESSPLTVQTSGFRQLCGGSASGTGSAGGRKVPYSALNSTESGIFSSLED